MASRALAVALVAAALLAPAASAHTSVFSSNGLYRIVVGQLDEPVVTYQKSGLDLCFTLNNTARTPVTINPGDFEGAAGRVVLRSPSGQELAMALRSQFGRAGCYQFTEPYIPTEAGQYTIDLTGVVNGTAVSFTGVNAGGAVADAKEVAFPGTLDADTQTLADAVTALSARVGDLEGDLAEMKQDAEAQFAPGAPAALLALGLVGLAAAWRRKA